MGTKKSYDIISEGKDAAFHCYSFFLWPKMWNGYCKKRQHKFAWEKNLFTKKALRKIPNKKGIYTFILNPDIAGHCCSYLMYVGKADKLRERLRAYFGEVKAERGRPKIIRFLKLYSVKSNRNLYFYYSIFTKNVDLLKIEDDLLEAFIPPCNSDLPATVSKTIKGLR